MRIVQYPDILRQILHQQFLHASAKRTRVAYRRAFLYAGSKSYGVGSSFYKHPGTQDSFFARTTATIREADNLNIPVRSLERVFLVSCHMETSASRTEIFRLLASDNS